MKKHPWLAGLSLLCALALCAGCTPPATVPETAEPPATAIAPVTTPDTTVPATTMPEVNVMEQFEKYELTADKLDVSKWNGVWNTYMFPQSDGTLQFGMGVNELYCLGAYGKPGEMLDKIIAFDMLMILRPAAQILLRAPQNSGLGPGNPCYMLYFQDNGDAITMKLSRFSQDGTEDLILVQPLALNDYIDMWDYNRFEVGAINQGEDVRLLVAVNGHLLMDVLDETPADNYKKAGQFFIQGGHSTLRFRGTDSEVPSDIAKPVKTGEYNGVGMYDVSTIEQVDTRVMTTVTTPRVFNAANGMAVNYRIYLPANYDPNKTYPLHMHLHGGGLRGSDNLTQVMGDFSQLNMLIQHQKKEEFIFIVPECPADRFWSDSMTYDFGAATYSVNIRDIGESAMTKALIELLSALQQEFSVDAKRLYISGASMGGMGTYDIVARYPDMFAAALVGCAASDVTQAEALSKTPLYIIHGDQDTTVPVAGSHNMVAALEAINATNFVYAEIKGRGHDFVSSMDDLTTAMDWMYAKTR